MTPGMEKMDETKTTNTLNSIQKSLEDIFGKSYFKSQGTKKMYRKLFKTSILLV